MTRRLAALLPVAVVFACESNRDNGPLPSTKDSIHVDTARLGRILHWDSLAPGSAAYRIVVHGTGSDRVPGPTDWSIEAILRYDTVTFSKLIQRLGADSPSDSVKTGELVWSWLDSSDKARLSEGPHRRWRENTIFRIDGCPLGALRLASSSTLLLQCATR